MMWLLGGWGGSLVALWIYLTAAGAWHVHEAHVQDAAQCTVRIEQTVSSINSKEKKFTDDAEKATSNIVISDDIVSLCKQSNSCREHNSK